MTTDTHERTHVETGTDNPTGIYHLVCRSCVPVIPEVGVPYVRFCGLVLSRKPGGPLVVQVDNFPPEACVLCVNLENCAKCGSPVWNCH